MSHDSEVAWVGDPHRRLSIADVVAVAREFKTVCIAPVAAHLARGIAPAKFGPLIEDYLKIHTFWPTRTSKRLFTGQVLKIDRFGNLISNFSETEFGDIKTRPFALSIGTEKIQRLALNYAEVPFGEPVAIIGSSGFVEVCVNQGHAAKQLGCGVGAPIELTVW